MTGHRYRLVTRHDGGEHVSSVVLSEQEARESLDVEADMHRLAGWVVVRPDLGGIAPEVWAINRNAGRIISARCFDPMTDTLPKEER